MLFLHVVSLKSSFLSFFLKREVGHYFCGQCFSTHRDPLHGDQIQCSICSISHVCVTLKVRKKKRNEIGKKMKKIS